MMVARRTATYCVIYWIGGAEAGEWRWSLSTDSRDSAIAHRDQIVREGRAAYIHLSTYLERIGMPEGPPPHWDFDRLTWKVTKKYA